MKSIQITPFTLVSLLLMVGLSFAELAWNPAEGIFIQRVGMIYDSEPTSGTLYYTRYGNVPDRVKSVEFYYDGQGYFQIGKKDTLCGQPSIWGADGIMHHPDGDLLIAGQSDWLFKVKKDANLDNCLSKGVQTPGSDNYHLILDPSNEYLWGLGIPGPLIRYPISNATPGRLEVGTKMPLNGDRTTITTIAWDHQGTVFYTASDYSGKNNGAQFGIIDMQTYKTTRLFYVPEGAHGMTYDEYSKTIFIFGGSHIIQIDPISRTILADLDMYELGFTGIKWPNDVKEWRFDQGTTDGKGHLLVASNSGHLVFIDYTSNINKRIDNNILIHAQFLDHWLDDVAPLSGVGSPRSYTSANSGTSSSSRVYSSSSYAIFSSSSTGGGTSDGGLSSSSSSTGGGTSDGGLSSSSSSTGGGTSDGGLSSSSSSTGGGTSDGGLSSSSSSDGGGTSDGGLSSSSSSDGGGTSDGGLSSSSSSDGGGTSDGGLSSSSSSDGGGTSDGGLSSSSSSDGGGTSDGGLSSSSSGTGGGATDVPWWCEQNPNAIGCTNNNEYGGATDYELITGGTYDQYPSNDARDKGNETVTGGTVLVPVAPGSSASGGIEIGGSTYLPGVTGGTILDGFDPSYDPNSRRDSIPVGSVVQIDLDPTKLAEYLGWNPGDTLVLHGGNGVQLVDPQNPALPSDQIAITDDSFWITAPNPVSGGVIYISGPNGKTLIFDGIYFYDPIPKAKVAMLKDPDGDSMPDKIEIVLADVIPEGYTVTRVQAVVKGTTHTGAGITVAGERIQVDVGHVAFDAEPLGPNDSVLITYTDTAGMTFVREVPLTMYSGNIINRAVVIRNPNGSDSLFVEFNLTILPTDLAFGEMMILVNAYGNNKGSILADRVRLPAKSLLLYDGLTTTTCATEACTQVNWSQSGVGDSVQLSRLAFFQNMPFIASEEYTRRVPIQVIHRLPQTEFAEYYDTNGDGTLDSVVVQLATAITPADAEMLNFAFPWYSSRNKLIQLQPQSQDLVIDLANPNRVGWKVQSNVTLKSGLTHIPSDLPLAELYVNYPVFDNVFQEERRFPVRDKMAPAIADARMRYGDVDSLVVSFSEPVAYEGIGLDLFRYIHGKDTMDLQPLKITWSADGLNATLVLPSGVDRVVPGDSLLLNTGVPGRVVVDALGNMPVPSPSPVEIQGSLTHLVETVKMGNFDPDNEALRTVSSVTVSYVPGEIRTKDLRDRGELGHIIELGQRFVPQLIDNATNGEDPSIPLTVDPSKVFISLKVQYYDHVGQFVTDTVITIPCENPKFGGNCLETDKKMFVNWNYKNKDGRFVASGVYLVNFELQVRYEKKVIKEEMLDKWGVRRKKQK